MANDLSYYLKYINFQGAPQNDIQELSDNYSQQLSDSISAFSVRINSSEAISVKLNDVNSITTYKAVLNFRKVKNANEDSVVRNIQTYPNIIKQGDYIYYNNETYLVITKVENKPTYNPEYSESLLKICNNNLKFIASINGVDTLLEIPCILSNGIISVEENKYITTPSNQLTCMVGTAYIDKIKYIKDSDNPTRFIIMGKAYKTIGIDNVTNVDSDGVGVIIIKFELDEQSEYDDLINGIADRWSSSTPKPNYTFDMPDLITITRGAVASLNYLIKNNGITVTNPSLTVTVANTSVSTYNSTNNVFNGLIVGTTAATITFHGLDKDYTFTVNIRVVLTTVGDVITYNIISNDSSIKGESTFAVPKYITKTFYCQKYINGVMTDGTYNVGYTFTNADSAKVQVAINNGSVDITNLGNTTGSINFTFTDNVTKTVTLKTITFVA